MVGTSKKGTFLYLGRFTRVQRDAPMLCTTQYLQFKCLTTSGQQLLVQTLDRSHLCLVRGDDQITFLQACRSCGAWHSDALHQQAGNVRETGGTDRKSTRLNSSHGYISYAVFCLKKKK